METALRNRLLFGSLMGAAILGLLWLDHLAQGWTIGPRAPHGIAGLGLLALLWLILPPATIELATLFAAERVKPYRFIASIGSTLLVTHAWGMQFPAFQKIAAPALAFVIVFVMLFAALRRAWGMKTEHAIVHMAGTSLATLYLGGLAWFLMALRVQRLSYFVGSTLVVLMVLLVVKFTDIGAYFGGRAIGKHKLIPWLSPGKTWEGLACGLLVSGAIGLVASPFAFADGYPLWQAFVFSVILGAIGQLGDLLESLMKRDAEVKDSGSLIPGFGGILDVIDSPLLAAPFAYLLFSLF